MSVHEVTGEAATINFAATGTEEILQNVRTILATIAFTCPLARDFAWNPDVDAPINVVQAQIIQRVMTAIRTWEPRVEVVSITFDGDPLNGQLKPKVKVRIADGAI
ncbi:GPW/gp25 family protein [Brevibacillus composti]|uniref:GPW/gp25 family protein n=1 Tax=Brevibacillus composti TaxID=2796470 RepID=A0A7T5ENA8_9BACL|nr:GPW/gp25 family protein [Brevibacillus composti]QQE75728.1 GPW/gp25 family protein [Brevibacillus composti]QUO42754.1 GPW/gp25 family protein [Brevibacillus composti]